MQKINGLPQPAHLADVLKKFPKGMQHLLRFHDEILRTPSSLSLGERELLAAWVSSVNACGFCAGIHARIAEMFGQDQNLINSALQDLEHSAIPVAMKPILAFAKKLTLTPAKMTPQDSEAIRAAGWDEQAIFDTVVVTSLFNLMNRIVEGTGVSIESTADIDYGEAHKKRYLSETSYQDFGQDIGIMND